MKIEAYVLVMPGCEPCCSNAPWESLIGKWYRLTAEVPDPVPFVDVPAVAEPQGEPKP